MCRDPKHGAYKAKNSGCNRRGAGCIGTNLSRKLAELNAKVIILDDLSSAYE